MLKAPHWRRFPPVMDERNNKHGRMGEIPDTFISILTVKTVPTIVY
ncbi:hypothetical protein H6G96_33895 [Nostoc sp. FACHB-892]|nr:hypothetical protein [Nostoc sp. FACHB-892]